MIAVTRIQRPLGHTQTRLQPESGAIGGIQSGNLAISIYYTNHSSRHRRTLIVSAVLGFQSWAYISETIGRVVHFT